MKIKWLGHHCVLITSEAGIKIITDPYSTTDLTGTIPGKQLSYGEITESADIVTVSHEHFDHNNVAAVKGNPEVVSELIRGIGTTEVKGIEFRVVDSYHDEVEGSWLGRNSLIRFEVDGISVCHLGDLGQKGLTGRQLAELGRVDILITPVGGHFVIGAEEASLICDQLRPKVVIPTHFKTDKCFITLEGVDDFLLGGKTVRKLDVSEVSFRQGELPASMEVIVLKPAL